MYTVPAKVPIQAKQLIATFENGGRPVATNDGTLEASDVQGVRLNREVSVEELAQPGTARRLLQEFESRTKQSTSVEAPLKSPSFRTSNRLSASDAESNDSQRNGSVMSAPASEIQSACKAIQFFHSVIALHNKILLLAHKKHILFGPNGNS
jgi:hypothetical protein